MALLSLTFFLPVGSLLLILRLGLVGHRPGLPPAAPPAPGLSLSPGRGEEGDQEGGL